MFNMSKPHQSSHLNLGVESKDIAVAPAVKNNVDMADDKLITSLDFDQMLSEMGKDVAGPTIKMVNNDTLVEKNVNNAATDMAPGAKNLVSEDPLVAVHQEVEIVDEVIQTSVHVGGAEVEDVEMSNKGDVEEADTQSNNEEVDKLNDQDSDKELDSKSSDIDEDELIHQTKDFAALDHYKWKDSVCATQEAKWATTWAGDEGHLLMMLSVNCCLNLTCFLFDYTP